MTKKDHIYQLLKEQPKQNWTIRTVANCLGLTQECVRFLLEELEAEGKVVVSGTEVVAV